MSSSNSKILYKTKVKSLGLFLLGTLLFTLLVAEQRDKLDPSKKFQNLLETSQIKTLENWTVDFEACDKSYRNCEHVGENSYTIELPSPQKITEIIESIQVPDGKKVRVVYINSELDFSTKAWIRSQVGPVNLVIPTFVAANAQMTHPVVSRPHAASQHDLVLSVPKNQIGHGFIRIKVLFQYDANWFGPEAFPPALVNWFSTKEYANIDQLTITTAHVNRMLEIVVPLLIAAMALIIDHAAGILFLSLFAVTLAARSLVSMYIDINALNTFRYYLLGILYGLSPVFLIRYAIYLAKFKIPNKLFVSASIIAPAVISFLLFKDQSSQLLKELDLWVDGISAYVSIGILITALVLILKRGYEKDPENIGSSRNTRVIVLGTAILMLSLWAYANTSDILLLKSTGKKDLLHWAHQILLPGLLLTTMLDIGSIVNTIKRVSNIVREKTKLDRDIEIGKQLQSGILPSKKEKGTGWSWHAFYYPAAHLAGDWFDLREVQFQNGKKALLGCIVDVTGHGISSAMMTSNIASHWSLWCSELESIALSADTSEKKQILSTAPAQIHRGLIGLRYNLGCSMAVVMYEADTNEMTYLTAGHPGIVIGKESSFEYLTTQGTRPGVKTDTNNWQVEHKTLEDNIDSIILYTDGIVEHEKSVPVWLKHVRRDAKKSNKSVLSYFASQLRTNRKFFMKNPDIEDDLTLLIIKIDQD